MRKIVYSFLCVLLSLTQIVAQESAEQFSVRVERMSNTEFMQSASVLGKMSFEDGKLVVYDLEGTKILETEVQNSVVVINDEENQVVVNGDEENVIEILDKLNDSVENIKIYPNPTTDCITIEGLSEKEWVALYSLEGQQILRQQVQSQQTVIEMTDVTNGIYIMKAGNNLVKVVKQ